MMSNRSKVFHDLWNSKAVSQLWHFHPIDLKNRIMGQSFASNSSVTDSACIKNECQNSQAKTTHRTEVLTDIKISNRLRLIKPVSSEAWPYDVNPEKVLVIFLSWLNSKEKHVMKYVQLYLDIGLDVLCVKSKLQDFLWPPRSFRLSRELNKVLKESDYDHYIIHAVSIGAYNLTTFCFLAKDEEEAANQMDKVCGVIFDSIVIGAGRGGVIEKSENGDNDRSATDNFVKGMTGSIRWGKFIHPVVSLVVKLYFTLTQKHTLDYYEKVFGMLRDEPVEVPTLLFSSKNDTMCDKDVLQQLVEIWRDKHEMPITFQMWDVSGHAQHLSFHRKEYTDIQQKFVDSVLNGLAKYGGEAGSSIASKL